MNKDKMYLIHIKEAITNIFDYTKNGESDFFDSKLVQDAVIRNLEIIGEATKKLSAEIREKEVEVPWKEMSGLRDVLIHHYFGVDLVIVWNVVKNELPKIEKKIALIIEGLEK